MHSQEGRLGPTAFSCAHHLSLVIPIAYLRCTDRSEGENGLLSVVPITCDSGCIPRMFSREGRVGGGVGACRARLDRVRLPSRDPKRLPASLNWLCRPDTNSWATSRAYIVLGVATSEPESSAESLVAAYM